VPLLFLWDYPCGFWRVKNNARKWNSIPPLPVEKSVQTPRVCGWNCHCDRFSKEDVVCQVACLEPCNSSPTQL
jgi:hypothetical protein